MKKVLVMGGTGAMGTYVVPELVRLGYQVDVISLDKKKVVGKNVTYYTEDCMDDTFFEPFLQEQHYDGIIDFMLYKTDTFEKRYQYLLENTEHYIFLSTYRVYSSLELPIKEDSPLFLDKEGEEFLKLKETEYALYKACQERILHRAEKKNWTIVRPSITFSKLRYQLVTMEADLVIDRTVKGKKLLLPKGALDVNATMTWAGDVAKLFGRLLFNEQAYEETYSICTSEHHTWREIAEFYHELIGLEYEEVEDEEYIEIMGGSDAARYQLYYDRCKERIMDNSKILAVTGMKAEDFTPLKTALAVELASLPYETVWRTEEDIRQVHMDEWLESHFREC